MKSVSLIYFIKRAITDIKANRFLHIITTTIIVFSILIISAFTLFFVNARSLVTSWETNIRIIVFLDHLVSPTQIKQLTYDLSKITGVDKTVFIHSEEALEDLKNKLPEQSSLIEDLKDNLLPHSFEISLLPSVKNLPAIKKIAEQVAEQDGVENIEYGEAQLGKFIGIFNVFRVTVIGISILFFIAMVFITSNTIRLALYSRQQEIEIMRLVGATDGFIKYPFYIVSLIEGAVGSIIGLTWLFIVFNLTISYVEQFFPYADNIKFLSPFVCCVVVFCSTFIGWLGCYFSLKQFLK